MEYTTEVQKLFLEFMMQDAQNYIRVSNIFNPDNFDKSIRKTAMFMHKHALEHKSLPERAQIKAVTGLELKPIDDMNDGHVSWYMEEFEKFTRQQELSRAILKAADLLEAGDFNPVEKLIRDAVQISLTRDMGTDFFADPRAVLTKLKDGRGQISTGWPSLDLKLYGGFNRGELQIFAGGSGSGKSLVMQNLSCNWYNVGLNGVYITLELSEELSAMRGYSMSSGVKSREVFKNLDDVEMKIRMLSKKAGNFRIKYMAAQSNVNDIRAYLRELQIITGRKIDFLCVDYLDLLMPVSVKVNPNDQFIKDKYVSEELRNLAKELDVVFVTASQLNRSAVEEIEFDHSHIAGGISKINTADNVFGIFTSRSMRERGRYQIQLMKTRSSSGVGQKIDLEFDVDTLRITDSGLQDETAQPTSSILDKIKTSSTVKSSENTDVAPVKADVQSSKIKGLLATLKTSSDIN